MILNVLLLLFILCSNADGLITGSFNIQNDALKILANNNLLCISLRAKIQQKVIDARTTWIPHSLNSNHRQQSLIYCHEKHHSMDMYRKITTESSTRRKSQQYAPALPFLRYTRENEWNVFNPKSTRLFMESSATATSVDNISVSGHEETGQNNVNIFITKQPTLSAPKKSVTMENNGIVNITNGHSNIPNSGHELETDITKTNGISQQQQPQQVSPEDDVPKPTSNGGYTHTASSKAKISEANKGKTPWNKGRKRSAEDRARISAGVKARNREKLLKKIADMGMTEEEYNAKLAEDKRKKAEEKAKRRTAKGGYIPTEETKAKISKILLEKHKNGEIKKRSRESSSASRKGKKHSEETKKKISMSLKARWQGDPEYKENIKTKVKKSNSSEDVRERISNALKEKWKDPEFRAYMMERMKQRRQPTNMKRDAEYRRKISESMKRKWEDPEYRAKAMNGMVGKKVTRSTAERKKSTTARSKSDGSPVTKKKKKKKKTVSRVTPSVSATPASPLTLAEFAPKKKKRKKRTVKKSRKTNPKSATDRSEKNSERKSRETKMKDEQNDLYNQLYGAEDKVELKETNNKKSRDESSSDISNNYFSDDAEVDEFDDLFGDDEDDFNLDDFDPYGLDELEQSRY